MSDQGGGQLVVDDAQHPLTVHVLSHPHSQTPDEDSRGLSPEVFVLHLQNSIQDGDLSEALEDLVFDARWSRLEQNPPRVLCEWKSVEKDQTGHCHCYERIGHQEPPVKGKNGRR